MPNVTNPQNPLQKTPQKKRESVVTGKAQLEKKTLGDKFKETFIAEDFKDVRGEVTKFVIVPKLKEIVASIFTETINRLLFGQSRSTGGSTINRPFGSGQIHVVQSSSVLTGTPQQSTTNKSVYSYQKIQFESEEDALNVLRAMARDLADYKNVSVAAMNEYAGIDTTTAQNGYGWKNLDGATVERTPEGRYVLNLPRVTVL